MKDKNSNITCHAKMWSPDQISKQQIRRIQIENKLGDEPTLNKQRQEIEDMFQKYQFNSPNSNNQNFDNESKSLPINTDKFETSKTITKNIDNQDKLTVKNSNDLYPYKRSNNMNEQFSPRNSNQNTQRSDLDNQQDQFYSRKQIINNDKKSDLTTPRTDNYIKINLKNKPKFENEIIQDDKQLFEDNNYIRQDQRTKNSNFNSFQSDNALNNGDSNIILTNQNNNYNQLSPVKEFNQKLTDIYNGYETEIKKINFKNISKKLENYKTNQYHDMFALSRIKRRLDNLRDKKQITYE